MRSTLLTVLVALPCLGAPVDRPKLARLFGFAGKSEVVEAVPTGPLPFKLLGTMTGDRPLAAVSTESKVSTVGVGDFVLGIEVVSIESRKIGVRRGLTVEFLGFTAVVSVPSASRLNRTTLQQHLANPAQILSSARLIPVPMGFKAVSVAAGSLLESLGLRRGDVLRSVNGVKLDDPTKVMALYGQLPTTRRFDVEIERDGKTTTQTLAIDD